MALDFRVIGFGFGSRIGGEQTLVGSVDFGRPVIRAEVALKGFDSKFDRSDHEFLQHKILTSIERIAGSRVFVRVRYLLRDSSGAIDDPYSGGVHVLVFADVAQRTIPPVMFTTKKSVKSVKKSTTKRAASA